MPPHLKQPSPESLPLGKLSYMQSHFDLNLYFMTLQMLEYHFGIISWISLDQGVRITIKNLSLWLNTVINQSITYVSLLTLIYLICLLTGIDG